MFRIALCLLSPLLVVSLGCVSSEVSRSDGGIDPAPILQGNWYRPSASTTWQWQLTGTINSEYAVEVYDIDLFNVSADRIAELQSEGFRVICYFSAGSYEPFRPDSANFPEAVKGLVLEGFEDELWLDVRAESVLEIMRGRLDLAVQKGCDGVEPDNVDGYQNPTGIPLTDLDQLIFNKKIANEARMRDLAVGLKNDLDQVRRLIDYFDFSVNEQCHQYDECEALLPFVDDDKPVWNAEYDQAYVDDPSSICSTALDLELRTLILPLDLDDSFRITRD